MAKETLNQNSPAQREQARENNKMGREPHAKQTIDKKLGGPNRPAE